MIFGSCWDASLRRKTMVLTPLTYPNGHICCKEGVCISAKVSWLCGPAARQWSVAPFVERRNGWWLEWIERIISSPSIESRYCTVYNKRYWNLKIFKIQHSVYLLVNLAHVKYIKMQDTDWYTDKIPVTCRLEMTAGFPSWSRHLQSLRLHTCLPCQVHWPVPGLQQLGGMGLGWAIDEMLW